MSMRRAGALRHRLKLESASKTPDGGGGSTLVMAGGGLSMGGDQAPDWH